MRRQYVRTITGRVLNPRPLSPIVHFVREPAETIEVWDRRSRTFATGAIGFLALAVVLMRNSHSGSLPIVALLASILSVVVVIQGRVVVHHAQRALRQADSSVAKGADAG
jgi:hypothetical protein